MANYHFYDMFYRKIVYDIKQITKNRKTRDIQPKNHVDRDWHTVRSGSEACNDNCERNGIEGLQQFDVLTGNEGKYNNLYKKE